MIELLTSWYLWGRLTEIMNLKELKELIELVSEKGFAEFEVERQGFRLRISRFKDQSNSRVQQVLPPLVVTSPMHVPMELPASAGVDAAAQPAPDNPPATLAAAVDLHVIRSPIVGTFYRSSSPEADPFVKVGDRVEPDKVVCIIEAMKLMNEIQAEVSGTVVEIYAENAQPVEYAQPLFGIKT